MKLPPENYLFTVLSPFSQIGSSAASSQALIAPFQKIQDGQHIISLC